MVSTKQLLAQRLQQNAQKHQQAQETVKDAKEFRRNIAIEDIETSPYQPRKMFIADEIQTLAESIAEIGLLQPITVRKLDQGKYELIAGERRLKAHQHLQRTHIEALIVDVADEDAALLTLAENLKRQDLTDYEIYIGLSQLPESISKNKQRLAKSLSLNREDMYKYLSYAKLPVAILDDLNLQPTLLGRTAATAFKKFLADNASSVEAEHCLLKAWEKVKQKSLEQTKAVSYAQRLLQANSEKLVTTSLVRKIEFAGRVAGGIKLNHNQLKVSLNVSEIDEQDLEALEHLLKSILAKQVSADEKQS